MSATDDDARKALRDAVVEIAPPGADDAPERPARLLPESVAKLDDIFCGCGDTEAAWAWVKEYLRRLEGGDWTWKPEAGPEYIAVYLLDHLGLTEHGSTIRCPWLTDAGRELLTFLDAEGVDWQEKGPWIDGEGNCRWLPG